MDVGWKFADQEWWLSSAIARVRNPEAVSHALRDPSHPESLARPKDVRSAFAQEIGAKELDPKVVRNALFHNAFLAKWRVRDTGTCKELSEKALDGFEDRNQAAFGYGSIPYPFQGFMKRTLSRWLPCVRDFSCVTGRFGPGACAERYSHFRRFHFLREWCHSSSHWPESTSDACGSMNNTTARLHAVPKDVTKDRLITIEPMYSSFAQQWARALLLESVHCGPLKGSAMDLEYVDAPAMQRRLALRASKEQYLATVDLSDASDHITWQAVTEVFPSWVCSVLEATRSTEYRRDGSHDAKNLCIFAGMGNATTFVIETLFFAAAVKAVAWAHGLKTFVSVFGDDIICYSDVVPFLREMEPFLVVNNLKTFTGTNNLRESCGVFAYRGEDVTFPDIRGYPNTYSGALGVCELYTRLMLLGDEFTLIADAIRETGSLPCYSAYVPGFPCIWHGQFGSAPRNKDMRINDKLQCLEFRLPVQEQVYEDIPADDALASRMGYPHATGEALYTASLCASAKMVEVRRRSHTMCVYRMPTGRYRTRKRWLTAFPLPDLPPIPPSYSPEKESELP